ncbi:hypothetical protein [Thiolapillus sp.]|uniref:hypothetical protein n=1 Tax=Thiolapillus sp. TaxID=2017437 RepID=UPI003AF97CDD
MSVLLCSDPPGDLLSGLIGKYGLELRWVNDSISIPGSHFGDPEAGLIGSTLLVRADTPLHSAFHETCHYVCMDGERRQQLHTDAGGGYDEENGVCYLQITCPALAVNACSGTWTNGATAFAWVRAAPGSRTTPKMQANG